MPVLPAGAQPIRVLHLSDLHMAPWQRDKQEWVRSLARFQPDLIVETGDVLGHARGIEGVQSVTRRTGRAERDEHAEPVSNSELEVTLKPDADMKAVRAGIARVTGNVPGLTTQVGQPI